VAGERAIVETRAIGAYGDAVRPHLDIRLGGSVFAVFKQRTPFDNWHEPPRVLCLGGGMIVQPPPALAGIQIHYQEAVRSLIRRIGDESHAFTPA